MNTINKICYIFRKIDIGVYSFVLKKRFNSCGKGTVFNGKITVQNPYKIDIGKDCSLNHNIYINAYNPISIGDDVTISANATIVSTSIDYKKWFKTNKREHKENEGLIVGNHVWIGVGATILSGANITGEYVVVAANAVVTKPIVENYCVYAGNPAKLIKHFDEKEITDLI